MAEVKEMESPRPPGPLPGGEKSIAGKWFVLAVLLFAATMTVVRVAQARPHRELRDAAHGIQLAVERYAVDTNGSYPQDIQQLVTRGFIAKWPDNPYGPGSMQPLKLGDPAVPGGFVYVPHGVVIAMGTGASVDDRTVQPMEYDSYLLVFYGPRKSKERAEAAADAAKKFRGYDDSNVIRYQSGAKAPPDAFSPLATEGIDWERVEIMMTAGEDYVPDLRP
jgi:hypothetical protein